MHGVWSSNPILYGGVQEQIGKVESDRVWACGKKDFTASKTSGIFELLPSSPEVIQELRETRVNLNCWLDREDAIWKQRSRLSWFRNGDRNTRFFHAKASARF